MDQTNSNIFLEVRKPGRHLTLDERGMIQALHQEGRSLRYIARQIHCSPSTICYELKRGTPERKGTRGRHPVYTAKRGQQAYQEHRANSHRPCKIDDGSCDDFLHWMSERFHSKEKWSLDVCVGTAKRQQLFPPSHIPCTKTLYSMAQQGKLPISLIELPKALTRKPRKTKTRQGTRCRGRSIEERPDIVEQKKEIGHWEVDTVVGKKKGREAVAFTALEKVTRKYVAIRIPSRTSEAVAIAIRQLHQLYGDHFSEVFKTMTADNGPEFAELAKIEERYGTKVYFARPYHSWERGQNERCNAIIREYVPKGVSFEDFTDEDILHIADYINARPRKILQYQSPADLFENFLDEVYQVKA